MCSRQRLNAATPKRQRPNAKRIQSLEIFGRCRLRTCPPRPAWRQPPWSGPDRPLWEQSVNSIEDGGIAADRAGALGLCAHGPNHPSGAFLAQSDAALRRMLRKQPATLLAQCRSLARVHACSVIVARQIALRNKIPTVDVLRRLASITSFGGGAVRNEKP
jgi:hypothetical protein